MIKYSVTLQKKIVVQVLANDCDEAAVMAESHSDAGRADDAWKKTMAHADGVSSTERPSVVGVMPIEEA